MDSYTFGSHDFMMAIKEKFTFPENLPYEIKLNYTDMMVFLTILQKLSLYGSATHKDFEVIPGYGDDDGMEPIEEWAWSWLSGIAETLDVEGI